MKLNMVSLEQTSESPFGMWSLTPVSNPATAGLVAYLLSLARYAWGSIPSPPMP